MRLLIIEDDIDLRDGLRERLGEEGFAVDATADGERGSYLARTNPYDLIILDIGLPKKNGITIAKELRAKQVTTPILMLTVQDTLNFKLNAFNAGADDYVTKPFSFEELLARVRALTRRPKTLESEILFVGNLELNTATHKASRGKKQVYLTRKEYCLLEFMMRHKGEIVTRGMIMEHVWNSDTDPFSNTIEAHILNLRRKVDVRGKKKHLLEMLFLTEIPSCPRG